MKPQLFHAKGTCDVCKKDLDKLEIWVTPAYEASVHHGNTVTTQTIAGAAAAVGMCHGQRDERPIEFHIGILVAQGWRTRVDLPFFTGGKQKFTPKCDRKPAPGGRIPSSRTKLTPELLATRDYEKLFAPKPTPRKKGIRNEPEHGRDKEIRNYGRNSKGPRTSHRE